MTILDEQDVELAFHSEEMPLLAITTPDHAALIPAALQQQMVRYSDHAIEGMAPATVRGVKGDWNTYMNWCATMSQAPLKVIAGNLTQEQQNRAEDAALRELKAFFNNAITRGLRRSTLDRYLFTIRLAHKAARVPDPTELPLWKPIWKGLVKQLAKDGRNLKRPASPLGKDSVSVVVATLAVDADLRDLRDMALLCLASDTLARRQELARIRVDEITTEEGAGKLFIPTSKTDQAGHGLRRHVSVATMKHIERWKTAAGLHDGPLFRSVRYRLDRSVKPAQRIHELGDCQLSDKEVARIFKRRMLEAGLDGTRISGHSTRIGSTHNLARLGYSGVQIAQSAGWATEAMVSYYCRDIFTKDSAMAQARRNDPLPEPLDENFIEG